VAVVLCAFTALRCYSAFRHFAVQFASTVYNDFYAMVREEERRPEGRLAAKYT
jgi:hypothetical protein